MEDLAEGDLVSRRGGGTAPVRWLGHRVVDCRRHPRPLHLSPEYAVFVAGRLVPAYCRVNGATIVQEPVDKVVYWHVELPRHALLIAEGLPAESHLDTGNRAAFANAPGAVMAHPDFALATVGRYWLPQAGGLRQVQ